MIGNFRQVTTGVLEKLLLQPETIESFIYPESEEESEVLGIEQVWEGVHFLLTGKTLPKNYLDFDNENPLNSLIFGGQTIAEDIDLGYGPGRYLTANQVIEINKALKQIKKEELLLKYDADIFTKSEVYPFFWQKYDADYLLEYWDEIVQFYNDASNKGNAIIFYIN